LAGALRLKFHLKEVDLPAKKSAAGKGNLEALARAERYEFFAQVMRDRQLEKVATAHTLDDQAETVLLRFLRGAGARGLSGIAPRVELHANETKGGDKIAVIRPLLEISKTEIVEYLNQSGVCYRTDRTNFDATYLRNWVRLELLPKIRERSDNRLAQRLSQQSDILRAEDALLDDVARERLASMRDGKDVRRDLLLREPLALQRRLLRLWIAELRADFRAIDYAHMAEVLRLSKNGPPQFRCPIGNGWELVCEYQRLTLLRGRKKPAPRHYSYSLRVGETLHIPEARLQILSEASAHRKMLMPGSLTEAAFDAALLTAPLEVRNFRAGDRLQPLGMRGHKKVNEIFIDAKAPARLRDVVPLLTMAGEILWIPGYARSSIAKVTARTTSLICFKTVPERV